MNDQLEDIEIENENKKIGCYANQSQIDFIDQQILLGLVNNRAEYLKDALKTKISVDSGKAILIYSTNPLFKI